LPKTRDSEVSVDQKVVDEELPSEIDWNNLRRVIETGHRDRLARAFDHAARRPGLWQDDAVVECLLRHYPVSEKTWLAVKLEAQKADIGREINGISHE